MCRFMRNLREAPTFSLSLFGMSGCCGHVTVSWHQEYPQTRTGGQTWARGFLWWWSFLAEACAGLMTAHVHRVDGGQQTAGPAVRARPLEQAQLLGRNMRREQRVCARSGLTLHLWQTPAADGGRNSKNNNRRQQAREPPADGRSATPALVQAQTSPHPLDLFTW